MKKLFVLCAALLVAGNVCASSEKNLQVYRRASSDFGCNTGGYRYFCTKMGGDIFLWSVNGAFVLRCSRDGALSFFGVSSGGELRCELNFSYYVVLNSELPKMKAFFNGENHDFCVDKRQKIPFSNKSMFFPCNIGTEEGREKLWQCITEARRRVLENKYTVGPNIKLSLNALMLMDDVYFMSVLKNPEFLLQPIWNENDFRCFQNGMMGHYSKSEKCFYAADFSNKRRCVLGITTDENLENLKGCYLNIFRFASKGYCALKKDAKSVVENEHSDPKLLKFLKKFRREVKKYEKKDELEGLEYVKKLDSSKKFVIKDWRKKHIVPKLFLSMD